MDFYEDDVELADLLAAFDRGVQRLTEPIRRQIAERHKDEVVEGSGVPIAPKKLGTVRSIRMPEDLDAQVRAAAERAGVTTSDYLRRVAEAATRPVGFRCDHMSMSTGGAAVWASVRASCGCDLQPVYAAA